MHFTTPISIECSPWSIAYSDRLLLLGSCFTDNMARKMQEYYFQVHANPTGTLYNPVSISHHITDCEYDVAIITFGTAWVYVDKQTGQVVDNCQKRPASDFIRKRLTSNEIVDLWRPILQQYSNKRFIFTVSPIRHIKDGLHENQLSKGILLQAVDQLTHCEENAQYFPSYEIMLDELRDYRYYAADMLHPSDVAIQYIWERFAETYLWDDKVKCDMQVLHQFWQDEHHRILKPESEEAKQFQRNVEQKRNQLRAIYPWL